jgi:PqqD family protein of HPr-rel-A system
MWYRTGPGLVIENFDSAEIVFDPSTGETHFVNTLPALLLSAVEPKPLSLDALLRRLAGDVEMAATARDDILTALRFLAKAEIIDAEESQQQGR